MMNEVSSSIELSIVIPAFEEQQTIKEALTRLHEVLFESGISFEIILVIDGNVDETKQRAEELLFKNLKIVSYEKNMGKGHALKQGVSHVEGISTAFLDADLDIDCSCLVGLYRQLLREDVEVVVGSKVHFESIVYYPRFRRFQSKVMRIIVKALFDLDVSDTQTGIKVFKSFALLKTINKVHTRGFSFDVDLLTQLHDSGFVIHEGPIRLNYQFSSTTNLSSAVAVLRELFTLWYKRKRNTNTDE